jgi:hypothetical protein
MFPEIPLFPEQESRIILETVSVENTMTTVTHDPMSLPNREAPWSQTEFRARVREEGITIPSASLRLVPLPAESSHSAVGDGVFVAHWGEYKEQFVSEYSALSTPKAVETAIAQARLWASKTGLRPLVIAPYLSADSLSRVRDQNVSGVDLCGNGVLLAAHFSVWCTGSPNRFRSTQPIRNVYKGISSLFSRAFLLNPSFDSLLSLQAFTRSRLFVSGSGEQLAKGTASKVVQTLAEDLIVQREGRGEVRLTDAKKLLNCLKENYRKPQGKRVEGKMTLSSSQVWSRLEASGLSAVVTGNGSAGVYGLLSGPEQLCLYVSNIKEAAQILEVNTTRLFPNVELVETAEETMYFDTRRRSDGWWASPIQVWLELVTGGPRERDAAQVLYEALLNQNTGRMP